MGTCLRRLLDLLERFLMMLMLARVRLMRLYLLEDLPVSQRFRVLFPNTLEERSHPRELTQMRLLHTVLPFKEVFCLEREEKPLLRFFFWMLPHFPRVLRLLEVL